MGTFSVPLEVGDTAGRRFTRLEALADTGATNTCIPEDILHALGVQPRGTRRFLLADDSVAHYQWGQTFVRLMGEQLMVVVVFSPRGTEPLLGATTLEAFALAADPNTKQLLPARVPRSFTLITGESPWSPLYAKDPLRPPLAPL